MTDRVRDPAVRPRRGGGRAAAGARAADGDLLAEARARRDRRGRDAAARARPRRHRPPRRADGARPRRTSTSCSAAMAEAGIDDAFVIGGDATPPLGPYSSAVELLPLDPRAPAPAAHDRDRRLSGGSPADRRRRRSPTALAAEERGSPTTSTTQLCFDPAAILRLASSRGVDLPVIVGLPGIVDRRRLLEISMRVGVGPSLSLPAQAAWPPEPAPPVGGLADRLYDALAATATSIVGFHFFTFNRLLDTWSWDRASKRAYASTPEPQEGGHDDDATRASKTSCRRPAARSSWRGTRRSARTSTRRSPPSSRTGATSRSPGARRLRSSTSRTT